MTKHKRGRDAKSGKFITVMEARRRKATAVVESIKTRPRKSRKKSR